MLLVKSEGCRFGFTNDRVMPEIKPMTKKVEIYRILELFLESFQHLHAYSIMMIFRNGLFTDEMIVPMIAVKEHDF